MRIRGSICSTDECEAAASSKGLCSKCYSKSRRHGPDRETILARDRDRERDRRHGPNREEYLAKERQRNRARRASFSDERKEKEKKKQNAKYAANPERYKDFQRWNNTGFTRELVDALLVEQRGLCAICSCTMKLSGYQSSFCMTADHAETEGGKIPRKLLCSACNKCLGVYERHQRLAGLIIGPYEDYLKSTSYCLKHNLPTED
jgi:hypothetical protein